MSMEQRKILITGANGFVGQNLQLHLAERKDVEVVCFTRDHAVAALPAMLQGVDFVFHLAASTGRRIRPSSSPATPT